ncbi:MAG: hypothetical protein M3Y28_06580 [Armatimonadota bacterium]|nr:hypothetical protein [Armatimonadota bacterium]
MTNRDLYLSIGELVKRYAASTRTLEQYLLALLGLTRHSHRQSALPLSDFSQLLTDAFTAEPIAFDSAWQEQYDTLYQTRPGFAGWEAEIIRQIVDSREMDEAGTLKDEQRYFGINAPRGARWYNFDPGTFLECAMAGSLGGWEPGDATERDFVPGQVTVMASEGIQSIDPQDIERPIVEVPQLTWEQFQDFLISGQTYE